MSNKYIKGKKHYKTATEEIQERKQGDERKNYKTIEGMITIIIPLLQNIGLKRD